MIRLIIENKAVAFILICLFLVIVFMPSLAFAQVPPTPKPQYATWDTERIARLDRDWQSTGNMIKDLEQLRKLPANSTGSTSVYVGRKQVVIDGQYKEVKSVAVIKPTTKDVAKQIIKFGARSAAVGSVLYDLVGRAVDYVLDPKNNNVIVYKDTSEVKSLGNETYATGDLLRQVNEICALQGLPTGKGRYYSRNGDDYMFYCGDNNHVATVRIREKTITVEEVAEKVIEKADEGSVSATELVSQVADSKVDERKKQYDENSPVKPKVIDIPDDTTTDTGTGVNPTSNPKGGTGTGSSTSTDTKTDTATDNPKTNPSGQDNTANSPSFELPPFCSWATVVCEFIEWYKKEPELKDSEVPTKDIELTDPSSFDKDYVNVQAQCPADVVRDIPIGPNTFKLTFEMSPICDFASTYMRPVLIFMSYILGALMIGNAVRVD